MSAAAAALRRLTARVEDAAAALAGARFGEFAEAAMDLEAAETPAIEAGDGDATAACRELRSSLDRLGALLGHVAGVQLALRGLDATQAALYGRDGSGLAGGGARIRKEA